MVLVFPLLAAVLAIDGRVLATELRSVHVYQVHVPYADNEVFEFDVSLELLVQVLVVLHELFESHGTLATETSARIVECSKHFKEAKASFFDGFEASFDLWMSAWIELLLDFVKLERSVTVHIQFLESFTYETLSQFGHLTTESR